MNVLTYFAEERIQNLICLMLGSLSVILSLLFLFIIRYSFYKGMAVPLLVFGALQLAGSVMVFMRSEKDAIRVEQRMEQQPEKIDTGELARMQKVLKKITLYQWAEIILILAGLTLYLRFYRSSLTFWKGLGLGLAFQVSVVLVLDTMAKNRAEEYIQCL
jgi:hypothetical protein